MQCADGHCVSLLSSFCLQEKRMPPDFDSLYRPARPGDVSVVVTMADGAVVRLEADGLLEFRTRYGFTAMEAHLSLDGLPTGRPASVVLEVDELAALLPVVPADDPVPLSDDEIRIATGPWRLAARDVMEGEGEGAVSARVAMRLANALPLNGDIAAGERESLWRRVAGTGPELARQTFDACIRSVDQAVGYPLRKCLAERHEKLQIENTREFWLSLGGS